MSTDRPAIQLFYCYAHHDRSLWKKLDAHLATLRQFEGVETWHDGKILSGDHWEREIFDHLNTAHIILFLLSPDFFNSKYCQKEMQRGLERHRTGDARIVPILLRPVDWENTPLAAFSLLPSNKKAVTSWSKREEAFAAIVKDLRRVVIDLQEQLIAEQTALSETFQEHEAIGQAPRRDQADERRLFSLILNDAPAYRYRSYQSLNSYGVIGNCSSTMLIAPDGSMDWGCLPDFDSPAIFCRLIDATLGGYFKIAPSDETLPGLQRYLPGSNVLQTRFSSTAGEIILTDFLPIESLDIRTDKGTNKTQVRDDGARQYLVRFVECTQGELPVTMRLRVNPDYAAAPCEISPVQTHIGLVFSSENQHIAFALIGASGLPSLAMTVEHESGARHPTVVVQVTLHKGERLTFAIGVRRSEHEAWRLVEEKFHQRNFDWELAQTLHCWRTWMKGLTYHGPYTEWVERSALVLKMMTYAPTGAIVPAPTTSLPEEIGAVRNWDYRYATFTLYALNVLGLMEEAHAFTHWLRRLPNAKGEDLTGRELTQLRGYRDSRPVCIGNGAADQKQLDVFGEILDCIHLFQHLGGFERYGERLEGPLWSMLCMLVEHVCDHWYEPDSGIWEVRGGPRHFVYSKVMCWVALDRGIRIAEQLNLEADLPRWRMVRDQIRADILARGYNTQIGAFTQSYDSDALDASSLLLPLVHFIAPDDPRMRSTVDRIVERLTDERGFVYRYRADDGLPGGEGTFTLCTFWLVDNLALQGRIAEARSLFERLLGYASHLGLFSEVVDSQNDTVLGKYPHIPVHVALINSVFNLRMAEMRTAEHRSDPIIAAIRWHDRLNALWRRARDG